MFIHGVLLCGSPQGIKPISYQFVLYCAITIYRHLTLKALFDSAVCVGKININKEIDTGTELLQNIIKIDDIQA